MAANFWLSSHCKNWMYSREKVSERNRQNEDIFSEEHMVKLKMFYTQYLQALGKKMKLRQRLIASAIVYFRRFYYCYNILDHDPLLIAPTALYLAAKVEESIIGAKQVVANLRHLDIDNKYKLQDILDCEFFLLEALDFDLIIFHPYRPLSQYLVDAKLQSVLDGRQADHFAQTAWYLLNDSYRTDVCLCHAPHMIALAAIYIAGVVLEQGTRQWVEELSVDMQEVMNISTELVKLYNTCSGLRANELEQLHQRRCECIRHKSKRNLEDTQASEKRQRR